MKMLALVLVSLLCFSLAPEPSGHYPGGPSLNQQHQLINRAAGQLNIATLADLSRASQTALERGYVEYRLALAAEAQGRYPLMWRSLGRAEQALTSSSKNHSVDTQALLAAVHLRRMLHSEEPEPHRRALQQRLTSAYLQEPDNPTVLLVSAMAAHHNPALVGGNHALADLLLRDAEGAFSRRCHSRCEVAAKAYLWQGLAQSVYAEIKGREGPATRLIAQSDCDGSTGS